MLIGYLSLIIGVIVTLVSIPMATSSSQLNVQAFSTIVTVPAYAAVFVSWFAGCCCAIAYRQFTLPKIQSDKIRADWQKQDVKLDAEIQSDKEKRLEEKIATLEVALDRALKRKST
jgi:hypothetical protein